MQVLQKFKGTLLAIACLGVSINALGGQKNLTRVATTALKAVRSQGTRQATSLSRSFYRNHQPTRSNQNAARALHTTAYRGAASALATANFDASNQQQNNTFFGRLAAATWALFGLSYGTQDAHAQDHAAEPSASDSAQKIPKLITPATLNDELQLVELLKDPSTATTAERCACAHVAQLLPKTLTTLITHNPGITLRVLEVLIAKGKPDAIVSFGHVLGKCAHIISWDPEFYKKLRSINGTLCKRMFHIAIKAAIPDHDNPNFSRDLLPLVVLNNAYYQFFKEKMPQQIVNESLPAVRMSYTAENFLRFLPEVFAARGPWETFLSNTTLHNIVDQVIKTEQQYSEGYYTYVHGHAWAHDFGQSVYQELFPELCSDQFFPLHYKHTHKEVPFKDPEELDKYSISLNGPFFANTRQHQHTCTYPFESTSQVVAHGKSWHPYDYYQVRLLLAERGHENLYWKYWDRFQRLQKLHASCSEVGKV